MLKVNGCLSTVVATPWSPTTAIELISPAFTRRANSAAEMACVPSIWPPLANSPPGGGGGGAELIVTRTSKDTARTAEAVTASLKSIHRMNVVVEYTAVSLSGLDAQSMPPRQSAGWCGVY